MSDKVTLSFSDSGVATATISNPPLNIYDLEMRDGLIEAFSAVRDNPDLEHQRHTTREKEREELEKIGINKLKKNVYGSLYKN